MESARDLLAVGGKVAVVGLYFVFWWAGYTITNEFGVQSPRSIALTRPVDLVPELFQPWTAIVYVGLGMALPLFPFYYYRTWPKLGFVLGTYSLTTAISFACYGIWPMTIARPSFDGPGVGRWLMREVVAVDGAANCVPSSHVFYAVLAGLLLDRAMRTTRCRILVWPGVVAVAITTITTGQHYFVDVLGGTVVAAVGYFSVRAALPIASRPDSGGR